MEESRKVVPIRSGYSLSDAAGEIIAESPAMKRVLERAEMIAPTSFPVLITGESGTGKELVAGLLARFSARVNGSFIKVLSSGFSETLVESELFGHEKGAFTGAKDRRVGMFEAATDGTLLLDEIGEISPNVQAKLLRVLEEREIQPVGSNKTRRINTRVIAATNRDLQEMVDQGKFRGDLLCRFPYQIHIPPLSERPEDILPLARKFLLEASSELQLDSAPEITRRAEKYLLEREWPGNARDIRKAVLNALVNYPSRETLDVDVFGNSIAQKKRKAYSVGHDTNFLAKGEIIDLPSVLKEVEIQYILEALSATDGNKKKAAEMLGMNRTTLSMKMKSLGIPLQGQHVSS
ncbi:MAG: sigma-54 dependent transcriptional regulator [Patescibacteria group bacterium]|jgi:DNA-binding NtrC family response regulator